MKKRMKLRINLIAQPPLFNDSDLLLKSASLSFPSDVPNFSMSREQLIKEQEIDPSLSSCFQKLCLKKTLSIRRMAIFYEIVS